MNDCSQISRFRRTLCLLVAASCISTTALAQATREVRVALSFFASPNLAGYYAAQADGIYKKYGLDVKITQVGAQANNLIHLSTGKADFINGWSMRSLIAAKESVPLVSVAAVFQRDPQCFMQHKGAYANLEQMKGAPLRMSQGSMTNWWPWLKSKYGFDDSQIRPFDQSVSMLLQNPKMLQQEFITDAVFKIKTQNLPLECKLLADYGWPGYNGTIDTTPALAKSNPQLVTDFVKATLEGYKAFLKDPVPAAKLIRENNPLMSDAQISDWVATVASYGLLESGDASDGRIGNMTEERWKLFYDTMLGSKAIEPLDCRQAFDTQFVRKIYSSK